METWSNENRIYQQLQYAGGAGRLGVVQRVRNEQRWKQEVVDDSLTGESSFSDRVRYLLSLSLPVAKAPRPLALVLSDEILLQFGHSVVLNTFDQNRLFGGIKVSLSRAWSFDLGYMQVFQQKASGYQYDLDHTLRFFFYWTPDRRGGRRPRAGRRGGVIMSFFVTSLRENPELAIFLTLAVGFVIGRFRIGSLPAWATSSARCWPASSSASSTSRSTPLVKIVFFDLFLFATGYKVGPQFFRGLKKNALPQVALTIVLCVVEPRRRPWPRRRSWATTAARPPA